MSHSAAIADDKLIDPEPYCRQAAEIINSFPATLHRIRVEVASQTRDYRLSPGLNADPVESWHLGENEGVSDAARTIIADLTYSCGTNYENGANRISPERISSLLAKTSNAARFYWGQAREAVGLWATVRQLEVLDEQGDSWNAGASAVLISRSLEEMQRNFFLLNNYAEELLTGIEAVNSSLPVPVTDPRYIYDPAGYSDSLIYLQNDGSLLGADLDGLSFGLYFGEIDSLETIAGEDFGYLLIPKAEADLADARMPWHDQSLWPDLDMAIGSPAPKATQDPGVRIYLVADDGSESVLDEPAQFGQRLRFELQLAEAVALASPRLMAYDDDIISREIGLRPADDNPARLSSPIHTLLPDSFGRAAFEASGMLPANPLFLPAGAKLTVAFGAWEQPFAVDPRTIPAIHYATAIEPQDGSMRDATGRAYFTYPFANGGPEALPEGLERRLAESAAKRTIVIMGYGFPEFHDDVWQLESADPNIKYEIYHLDSKRDNPFLNDLFGDAKDIIRRDQTTMFEYLRDRRNAADRLRDAGEREAMLLAHDLNRLEPFAADLQIRESARTRGELQPIGADGLPVEPEYILLKARLGSGTEPGVKELILNGAPVSWMLQYSDNQMYSAFVRDDYSSNGEPTPVIFAGERFLLEARAALEWSSDTVSATLWQYRRQRDGSIESVLEVDLELQRVAADSTLYRSRWMNAKWPGAPLLGQPSTPGERVINVLPDDWFVASITGPNTYLLSGPATAALRSHPGVFSWSWNNSVQRALACYPDANREDYRKLVAQTVDPEFHFDVSGFLIAGMNMLDPRTYLRYLDNREFSKAPADVKRAVQELLVGTPPVDVGGAKLPEDERRPESFGVLPQFSYITLGHHAAAILIREKFVNMMAERHREMRNARILDPSLTGYYNAIKARRVPLFAGLEDTTVTAPNGRTAKFWVLRLSPRGISAELGIPEAEVEAWRHGQFLQSYGSLLSMTNDSIDYATSLEDCDWPALFEFTSLNFGAVAAALWPEMMELHEVSPQADQRLRAQEILGNTELNEQETQARLLQLYRQPMGTTSRYFEWRPDLEARRVLENYEPFAARVTALNLATRESVRSVVLILGEMGLTRVWRVAKWAGSRHYDRLRIFMEYFAPYLGGGADVVLTYFFFDVPDYERGQKILAAIRGGSVVLGPDAIEVARARLPTESSKDFAVSMSWIGLAMPGAVHAGQYFGNAYRAAQITNQIKRGRLLVGRLDEVGFMGLRYSERMDVFQFVVDARYKLGTEGVDALDTLQRAALQKYQDHLRVRGIDVDDWGLGGGAAATAPPVPAVRPQLASADSLGRLVRSANDIDSLPTRLGDDVDVAPGGATAEELFAPRPGRFVDGQGREIELGARVGRGQYFDVYEILNAEELGLPTDAGRRHVIKLGEWNRRNGLTGPGDVNTKITMMEEVQERLAAADIPHARIAGSGDINGRPYFLQENVDESFSQTFSNSNVDKLWRRELHGKALVELTRKLSDAGLVWLDGQRVNAYYNSGAGGVSAGILDLDLIAPIGGGDKVFREFIDGLFAPNALISSLVGFGHEYTDAHYLNVKMMEHRSLVKYRGSASPGEGRFVSSHARVEDVEAAFPGFQELVGNADVTRDARFGTRPDGSRGFLSTGAPPVPFVLEVASLDDLDSLASGQPSSALSALSKLSAPPTPLRVGEVSSLNDLGGDAGTLAPRSYFRREDVRDVVRKMYETSDAVIPRIHTTTYENFGHIVRDGSFNPPPGSTGPYFSPPGLGVNRAGEIAIRPKRGSEPFLDWRSAPGQGDGVVFYKDGVANKGPFVTYIPNEHLLYLDPGDGVTRPRWREIPSPEDLPSGTRPPRRSKPVVAVVPGTYGGNRVIGVSQADAAERVSSSPKLATARSNYGDAEVQQAVQQAVNRQARKPDGPILNVNEVIDQANSTLYNKRKRGGLQQLQAESLANDIIELVRQSDAANLIDDIDPDVLADELAERFADVSAETLDGDPSAAPSTLELVDLTFETLSEISDPNATLPPPPNAASIAFTDVVPEGTSRAQYDRFVAQLQELQLDARTARTVATINLGHQLGENGAIAGVAIQRGIPFERVQQVTGIGADDMALALDRYLEEVMSVTDPVERMPLILRYMGDDVPDGVWAALGDALVNGPLHDPMLPPTYIYAHADPYDVATPLVNYNSPGFSVRMRLIDQRLAAQRAIAAGDAPGVDVDRVERAMGGLGQLAEHHQNEIGVLSTYLAGQGVNYFESVDFLVRRYAQEADRLYSAAGRAELLLEAAGRYGTTPVALGHIASFSNVDEALVRSIADDVRVAFDAGIDGNHLIPAALNSPDPARLTESVLNGVESDAVRFWGKFEGALDVAAEDAQAGRPGARLRLNRVLQVGDDLELLRPSDQRRAVLLARDLHALSVGDIDALEFAAFEVGRRALGISRYDPQVALAEGIIARGRSTVVLSDFADYIQMDEAGAVAVVRQAYANLGLPPNPTALVPVMTQIASAPSAVMEAAPLSAPALREFNPVVEARELFGRAAVLRRLADSARGLQALDVVAHYDGVATGLQRQATALMFGNLRFGPEDVVYGPTAHGALARLAEHGGAPTLFDFMDQKRPGLANIAFSQDILEDIAAAGNRVHFDLTHLDDIPGMLAIEGLYAETQTAAELRFIRTHWDLFESVVVFYRDGVVTAPPWTGAGTTQ